jgi:hypothetical protein
MIMLREIDIAGQQQCSDVFSGISRITRKSATIAPRTMKERAIPTSTEGNVDTRDAQSATSGHNENERRRDKPNRTATELEGENTDHDHSKEVIQSGDRMAKSMPKARCGANAGMSVGGGGKRYGQ